MNKLELAAKVLDSSRMLRFPNLSSTSRQPALRVLAYHKVALHATNANDYPHDLELVSTWADEFQWQIAYLVKHFQVVTAKQLANYLQHGVALPERAVLITFDDGFLDNYEVAFPILAAAKATAIFFIATDYVGTLNLYWFDWVVHSLLVSKRSQLSVPSIGVARDLPAKLDQRRLLGKDLLRQLKLVSNATRLQALAEIESSLDVSHTAAAPSHAVSMSWQQMREMRAAGMEFGSHTASHPILSRISDPAHLRDELSGSKRTIESNTGYPVDFIAYSVGGKNAVDENVIAYVKEAGYKAGFTYQRGVNFDLAKDTFMMKRLPIERYVSRSLFKAMLELPTIFAR
jgi:peptidoglycan/xylan/chitin deacetylase (PgdA/CDA1 family)